jgi:hypothetical protein
MAISFAYTVTTRTLVPLPVLLRGTASDSSFKLTALTIIKTGNDHTIKKTNSQDRITVSESQHDALSNTALPYSITFTGNLQPNDDFIISSLVINSTLAPPGMASAPPPTGLTGTEDS